MLCSQCLATLLSSAAVASRAGGDDDACTGYPVGNFGIAAEVAPSGRIFSRILYNPPVLGPWLQELGRGRFIFECCGTRLRDSEFASVQIDRLYPEARAIFSDPRMPGLTISADLLAPIKAGDPLITSLPVLCADFTLANSSDQPMEVRAEFELLSEFATEPGEAAQSGGFFTTGSPGLVIGFDAPTHARAVDGGIAAAASVSVPAGQAVSSRFVLAHYHPDGHYAESCSDMAALVGNAAQEWGAFFDYRRELIELLPRTGDEQIDHYLRWYLQAAVLLTRITREHVLTLGYTELNQRDSYWTSWPHLVLWPQLERRMIEASAQFQRADGKIPTCILPVIEREDDIDINEYFNLRIARYLDWTHDLDFARQMWSAFKSSVGYLKSTDRDNDGLLDQGSFWADWKDVTGVEGRKAAPHFELLWLAVLKYAIDLAKKLGDSDAEREYAELYRTSSDAVHRNVEDGGLWTGSFYTTLWYDGRQDNHVQQDQTVGPLFGVVPADRTASIYRSMGPSMTDWGIRDTFPYRDPFNNVGGDYHNGGVWVFLNFADALSRFVNGHPKDALEILRRVGEWDLEKWGDYMPAEYLDGNTGVNAGKPIQGWDAAFYGAVVFGLFGLRMLSMDRVEILPRIDGTVDYSTPIVLPAGVLRLRQTAGSATVVEISSDVDRTLGVRFGLLGERTHPDASEQRVGECVFQVVEFDLRPGESGHLEFR